MAASAAPGRNPRRDPAPAPVPVPVPAGDRLFPALAPYTSFVDHLSLRLVSRSFRFFCRRHGRPPPPFPWLMLPERAAITRRLFYDIPGGRPYAYDVPGEKHYRCVASSAFGWLVLSALDEPRRLALVNPVTGARVIVAWPFADMRVDRFHAVLTASPADRACLLVVATDRLVAYCRPGRQGWLTLRAPGFRYDAASSDIVTIGAIVYLVDDRRKIWRADLADPEPEVERRSTSIALPFADDTTRMRHYLVESLRHVHLVLADEHSRRVSLFRLDWDRGMWVMPDNVSSHDMLLLGRGCSAAVPAAAARRLPGTVMFAHQPSLNLSDGYSSAQAWFWAESMVGSGPDDILVRKKTVPHRQGDFTAGDSFWFFPAIDPDESAVIISQGLPVAKRTRGV